MDASGQQDIRFCRTPRGRMAYASVGDGPVLLPPALWISHVELQGDDHLWWVPDPADVADPILELCKEYA